MAVAVKDAVGSSTPRSPSRLVVGSLAGTFYVLASLAIVFYGIKAAWQAVVPQTGSGSAVEATLRLLVMLAVTAGLVWLGKRLVGQQPPHGLRAGLAVCFAGFLAIGLITCAVGNSLEARMGETNPGLAMAVTAIAGLGLLVISIIYVFRPGFERLVLIFEDQGWFNATSYKYGQGLRVRRGTLIGILILAGCGVYTLLTHDTLTSGGSDWQVRLPFTGGTTLKLLPDVRFTVPILLIAVSLWLAYRVVNFPGFADFLIATEAEMNKVSWTTRRRLIQDTIVVLVTVFLFTAFMFLVDVVWVRVLSSPWIQVLQTGDAAQERKIGPLDW
jgi:preprotein translocase SecE subunit